MESERATATVRVRCTPATRARLTERASATGLTVSALMRQAGLTGCIRPSNRVELGAVAAQLGRVGGLINQLAVKANSGRIVPAGPVLAACDELHPILSELRWLLNGRPPTEGRATRHAPDLDDLGDDLTEVGDEQW